MMNEFLIRKAKKGDKDAFCRLMDEQVQCMYKVAFSYLKNDEDAADAIQDTTFPVMKISKVSSKTSISRHG